MMFFIKQVHLNCLVLHSGMVSGHYRAVVNISQTWLCTMGYGKEIVEGRPGCNELPNAPQGTLCPIVYTSRMN